MSWLIALFARLALLVVWVSTSLVNHAFHGGWILPLLGIILLPITTLSYVLVYYISGSVTGWAWLWVVLAFLVDLAASGYPARRAARIRRERVGMPAGPGSV
jgi:ABC-type lipoprotein release transport system permease subunit